MRFLFMQCVLELEEQRISSELFNVYLLAISMTDTFNQNEVENVVDLMKVKEIVPDIVTKISLFILYLRLGIEESNLWWPIIRKEVVELQGDVGKYPLLQLRLLHCFQTLVRLHHNTEIMDQCFSLVKLIAPRYLNQRNLVPYIMLGISNAASSPSALVEAVKCADDFKGDTPGQSRKEDHEPLLHNEVTLFRLLAKCCASGSLSDVDYLIQYAAFYEKHEIVAAANLPVIGLLHVYALVRSGALQDALRELDQLPPSYCTTGRKVHMTSKTGKTIIILNKDVIQTCVVALAAGGAEGVLRQLALMKEKPVSGNSLNVIMAALAHYHDYHAAEQLLGYYAESGVPISTFTLRSLLLSYQDVEPALGVTRAQSVLLALPKWGVPLEVELLNTILHLALEAGTCKVLACFLTDM
ncbi:hypothetical protein AGDE_11275 [Angomonas deanei]|uniref:Uncharacterized protein n=1 Tax=Angomonas deanei TaxID=59799 RepID=A0A7G2CDM5_9TRYP|nr:hypothetical protein AGDE_11275 [Angomonas deanei]CAD2217948.1 hypothetical protein, conserved [Angomonas deanei]|eukprot:EPY26486.1 hypothetical protein AGDE_11275 [Angomonas deanei]